MKPLVGANDVSCVKGMTAVLVQCTVDGCTNGALTAVYWYKLESGVCSKNCLAAAHIGT